MHHYDRGDGILDRDHGDRVKGGDYTDGVEKNAPSDPFPLPGHTGRAQGGRTYHDELYCQFPRAWLGGNPGRTESHGGAGEAGG